MDSKAFSIPQLVQKTLLKNRADRRGSSAATPGEVTAELPEWKDINEHMKESHQDYNRDKLLKQMGIGKKYHGYKGTLTQGDVETYSVSTPSLESDPVEYRISDDIVLYEPFVDHGVGTDKIRIMSSDYVSWKVDLNVAHVLKPIRRHLLQFDMNAVKDTPIFNVFVFLERFESGPIDMLLDWIQLHYKELDDWVDLYDDLEQEPELGKTKPFTDIKSLDMVYLDRLASAIYKLLFRRKYYSKLLELARVAVEMELAPLIILLKKYFTNLLFGKSPEQIWKLFQLSDLIPRENMNDLIYFDYLVLAKQEKLETEWDAKEIKKKAVLEKRRASQELDDEKEFQKVDQGQERDVEMKKLHGLIEGRLANVVPR